MFSRKTNRTFGWLGFTVAVWAVLAASCLVFQPFPSANAGGGQRAWQGTAGQPEDFLIEVEKGNIAGHSIVHKFGHGNVGTTLVPVSISLVYETPTAAVALEIVSDDAADALDDIGSWAYTVDGIDANYDYLSQTVAAHATTGLTAVAIPTSLLRLTRWSVEASGSYGTQTTGSHVGALSIRVSGGGATWSTIADVPIPQGQSEIGCYTVPDGFNAYIIQQDIHVDSTKAVDVVIMTRQGIDVTSSPFTPFKTVSHYVGVSGHNPTDFKAPMDNFPGRTDILYMAKVASSTADVSVHFSILLIKDGY
jgi:hypothetical protein